MVATPFLAVATLVLTVLDHRSAEADRGAAAKGRERLERMEGTLDRVADVVGAKSIDEIEKKLADLKSTSVAQGEKLQAAEASLGEMKRAAAPRTLSPEAIATLRKKLGAAPAAIELFVLIGDSEAVNYGDQFRKVFEDAGWTVTVRRGMFNPVLVGISLQLAAPEGVNKVPMDHPFATVHQALTAAGVVFKSERNPAVRDPLVRLAIGVKR